MVSPFSGSASPSRGKAPVPPPRRAPEGTPGRPRDREDRRETLRVDVPASEEHALFVDFSNGVTLTAGFCARCGSKAVGTCDVCGYRN